MRYHNRHAGWSHCRVVRTRRNGKHQCGDDEHNDNNNDGKRRKMAGRRPTMPYNYLHVKVARHLINSLDNIRLLPEGFPLALELGTRGDVLYDAIVDVGD